MHRSVAFGLYGVVIAGLVGGTITWATVDKTVKLDVDGQTTSFHTLSGTVKGALADAGYNPTERDIVAPGLSAKVKDDSEIVLRRGRLLKLTVDGQEREVWVNSPTVSQAMADLGYSVSTFTSVSRSKRLPLSPTAIDIRTPKTVTFVHDGQKQTLRTTAASVEQVVADAGVTVGAIDRISQKMSARPVEGMTIKLQRVKKGQVVETKTVPYATTSTPDATMVKGRTVVVTPGANGTNKTNYSVVYVDGVITGKTAVATAVVTKPTTQVQKVGTAEPPPAVSTPAAGSSSSGGGGGTAVPSGTAQEIAHQMVLARGWGEGEFGCLVSLWNKESGWNVHASNGGSGAYGIPQALPGSKMASAGGDWQDNAATQITWGLGYISGRYGTLSGARRSEPPARAGGRRRSRPARRFPPAANGCTLQRPPSPHPEDRDRGCRRAVQALVPGRRAADVRRGPGRPAGSCRDPGDARRSRTVRAARVGKVPAHGFRSADRPARGEPVRHRVRVHPGLGHLRRPE